MTTATAGAPLPDETTTPKARLYEWNGKHVLPVSCDCSFAAFAAAVNSPNLAPSPAAHITRVRINVMTRLVDENGDKHSVAYDEIGDLPVALGRELTSLANLSIGGAIGKVIGEGDGVDTPILFKLGTPIALSSQKDGAKEITELEFVAKTFGSIESFLSERTAMQQTIGLIRSCASAPEMPALTAGMLPSWVVDGISLADGLLIMGDVLPKFQGV